MSADLMLISTKQNENFENNRDRCVVIDETSMGDPHTDFGRILTGGGGVFGNVITDDLIKKTKEWFGKLEHKDYLDIDKIIEWMERHKDEPLETECW